MSRSLPRFPAAFPSKAIPVSSLRAVTVALSALLLFSCTNPISAAPILFSGASSDGHAVSGSAEFMLNAGADLLTVTLVNTTTATNDAGELFTGLDFSLSGLTPAMLSDTGVQRTVANDGTFADTSLAQDLSWSLISLGAGNFQLNFNPNAKDAIIGPPMTGNYSAANTSIKGNGGHNPFAAEMATFVLSVPNLESNTPISVTAFRYGTTLDPAHGNMNTPEPSTWVLLALGIMLLASLRLR